MYCHKFWSRSVATDDTIWATHDHARPVPNNRITMAVLAVLATTSVFALAKEPTVLKSVFLDPWKPHRIKQGDGKGGWVWRDAEYARIKLAGGYGGVMGLARMENDHVALVSAWGRRVEGKKIERPVLAISKDGGRTWGDFIVVPNASLPVHRATSLTHLGQGKLVFQAGGSPPPRRHFSSDYGKTWQYVDEPNKRLTPVGETKHPTQGWTAAGEGNQLVDRDSNGSAVRIAEFGSNRYLIEQGPDPWRTRDVSGKIAWSSDGGRTWTDEVEPPEWHHEVKFNGKIHRRGFVEGSFARAANGWIVAGLRTDIPPQYFYDPPARDNFCGTAVSVSKDDGRTWTKPQIFFEAGRHHANVQLLPNGDMLMTFIVRIDIQDGQLASFKHGCEAMVSHDNGLTWDTSRKYVLDQFEQGHNSGYNQDNKYQGYECVAGHIATTALSDGTILTSYGNYQIPGMVLIRWKSGS